jgi:hypothetical protein
MVLVVGAAAALGPTVAVTAPAGAAATHTVARTSAVRMGAAGGVVHSARGSAGAPFIPGTTVPGSSANRTLNHVSSSNWSGYAVQGTAFTDVVGSWMQPAVTCSATTTYSAFWIGIDGYSTDTVEQTGTEADCVGGRAVYSAWYEMYPAYPVTYATTVLPGDSFTAKVSRTGTTYALTITDATEGWTHTVHKSLAGAKNASAEWIAEAPCCTGTGSPLPLSDFGTVHFNGAKAAAGGSLEPVSSFTSDSGPHEISMTKGGKVIAQPSALDAKGTGFSIKRKV